jgi:hypothetical protein
MKTRQMASEISDLNKIMENEKREYILIGPGRWGSRDPFTGIPVLWANISKARVIVEIGLKDFPLDASLGSHFFHNVTSMNVGYLSVPHQSEISKLDFNVIEKQELIHNTGYVRHVRFDKPLNIVMDGRKRQALITYQE